MVFPENNPPKSMTSSMLARFRRSTLQMHIDDPRTHQLLKVLILLDPWCLRGLPPLNGRSSLPAIFVQGSVFSVECPGFSLSFQPGARGLTIGI
jgi:hypothetical protein